ncbi:MAG: HD domain-containing phosphohydrolase [Planctomycetota bacterium]
MEAAPRPSNDVDRLEALRAFEVLDTEPEQGFNDIVELAANRFSVPIALVSLIDEDRQWFKAKFGLEACQGSRDDSFCGHTILDPEVFVVEDASKDPRFADNPYVTHPPNIRFYAGAPLLTADGHALGSLCVIDDKPRTLTEKDTKHLEALARQVISQLELRRCLMSAERANDELQAYREELEIEVVRRTREIIQTREEVVHCLARASEYRDDNTGRHTRRVGAYVTVLAEAMGLKAGEAKAMGLAATLHDIGKIGVPDRVLLKQGPLDDSEFTEMREHATHGARIIDRREHVRTPHDGAESPMGQRIVSPTSYDVLRLASEIARTHHEHWDGSGYPQGLIGEDIPLGGRLTAVADVYDALGSARPYKDALPRHQCLKVIRQGAGSHFDPNVVEAFFDSLGDILDAQNLWADEIPHRLNGTDDREPPAASKAASKTGKAA